MAKAGQLAVDAAVSPGGLSRAIAADFRNSPLSITGIPQTVPELLRLPRDIVIPAPPGQTGPAWLHRSAWRRRRQAHQLWNAYAETTP